MSIVSGAFNFLEVSNDDNDSDTDTSRSNTSNNKSGKYHLPLCTEYRVSISKPRPSQQTDRVATFPKSGHAPFA